MAFTADGVAINSGRFTGMTTPEFKQAIADDLANKGLGRPAVNYKLRDWLFSRQHFWGEPFPLLHELDAEGRRTGVVRPLTPEELPVDLPERMTFDAQHDSLEPPLEKAPADWLYVARDGKRYQRETNTMPQWAGSCWYYLRFLDPQERRGPGRSADREGLDAGGSLRGRRGTCRLAPALRPLLAQGALRPRLCQSSGALPKAGQPGNDPGRDGVHRVSPVLRGLGQFDGGNILWCRRPACRSSRDGCTTRRARQPGRLHHKGRWRRSSCRRSRSRNRARPSC